MRHSEQMLLQKWHQEACSTQGRHGPSLCKKCNTTRCACVYQEEFNAFSQEHNYATFHTRESVIPIQRTGIFFPVHLCKDAQGFQPDCHRHRPGGHPNFIHVCPKLTWRRAGLPLSTLELQTPWKPDSHSHGLGLFLPL